MDGAKIITGQDEPLRAFLSYAKEDLAQVAQL